jgi:arginine exporter protein ArgO
MGLELADFQQAFVVMAGFSFLIYTATTPLRKISEENEAAKKREVEAYQNKLQQRRFLLDCL